MLLDLFMSKHLCFIDLWRFVKSIFIRRKSVHRIFRMLLLFFMILYVKVTQIFILMLYLYIFSPCSSAR